MLKGICLLTVIPMRKKKSDTSEMINQILFGETFEIIKKEKNWSYIELIHDSYRGWIDNKQYKLITLKNYIYKLPNKKISHLKLGKIRLPIIMGSFIPKNQKIIREFKINHNLSVHKNLPLEKWFLKISKQYLNAPYLWGGRTQFGIDCSGYTQMVYRFFNVNLPRDSSQQVKLGTTIKNLTESKLGDLLFFGNKIKTTHVGMYLGQSHIIHASGQVRIDKIDSKGIFNQNESKYTHKLQIIKRVL